MIKTRPFPGEKQNSDIQTFRKIVAFAQYFQDTWLTDKNRTVEWWNMWQYDTLRTTNHCESWHSAIRHEFNTFHPRLVYYLLRFFNLFDNSHVPPWSQFTCSTMITIHMFHHDHNSHDPHVPPWYSSRFLEWLRRHNLKIWVRSQQLRNGCAPRPRNKKYIDMDQRLAYRKQILQDKLTAGTCTWRYMRRYLFKVSSAVGTQWGFFSFIRHWFFLH